MAGRSYFDASGAAYLAADPAAILGALAAHNLFALDPLQRAAWEYQITHLKTLAAALPDAHFFLEFSIPRMGRRADVVVLLDGIVFVLEYKVGSRDYHRHDLDQTLGYALDLKNFHETSHLRRIVPVLVATHATESKDQIEFAPDDVSSTVRTNAAQCLTVLQGISHMYSASPLDPTAWEAGRYKPTPTIIEAAQALYRGHDVQEISRNEAGVENLSETARHINKIIDDSKASGKKSICFITGVPGSGKTLAGLNIANQRMNAKNDEHAVFLSGNGPLVAVLREALKRDRLSQPRLPNQLKASALQEYKKASAFIQNIHHFRDESVMSTLPPIDRVVVFDEAQRAWDRAQASKFMRGKRGHLTFDMSEPEFLLSVMDRHTGWCTVICLVGGGQEINTGEAGIAEWMSALQNKFSHWDIHISEQITGLAYVEPDQLKNILRDPRTHVTSNLHLDVSIRSFRAERVSEFVGALVDGDNDSAKHILESLSAYPIVLTRSLPAAKDWLRKRRRGTERAGLLASSNALRLKPEGVFMKASIEPEKWFLAPANDVRSSDALEDAASEFDVQGLELDWTCVCWDANLRKTIEGWKGYNFTGSKWTHINDIRFVFLLNSYRVLLTRARQGMVIFVPKGDVTDVTRAPYLYDPVYEFLLAVGLPEMHAKMWR